jgi:hypothetical protein
MTSFDHSVERSSASTPAPLGRGRAREVAHFRWGACSVSLDAEEGGRIRLVARDHDRRLSDWVPAKAMARWLTRAAAVLRLRPAAGPGEELSHRSPPLRGEGGTRLVLVRILLGAADDVRLVLVPGRDTEGDLVVPVSRAQARCFLGALGAAVGEAISLGRRRD